MLKRCLLFTENTYFFLSESTCVKLWVWRRHANDFVFRELWSDIILWCLQSKVPKRSHPNKLLTSVLLDTFLISLMASSLKRAKHIFRTSMNMWWKTLHVCLSNVKVGSWRDFIFIFLPKLSSNLTFSIAKGFSGILLYLNFDFKPSAFDMQMKLNGYKTNQKLVKKM